MSDILSAAVSALNTKLGAARLDGSAKFVITDEGSLVCDANGVQAGDRETDVTLTADAETFKDILNGDLDATSAFMSGRLSVDGDMGTAMQLAGLLG